MLIPGATKVSDLVDNVPTVPEATYNVRVQMAEYVAIPKTATAKGPYVKLRFVITGPGETKSLGRLIFVNLSMTGDSTFRLKEFLKATGHPDDFELVDTDQLVGLECGAAVVIQAGTGGYADKNEIRKYLPLV